jgi:hypothetical protein
VSCGEFETATDRLNRIRAIFQQMRQGNDSGDFTRNGELL